MDISQEAMPRYVDVGSPQLPDADYSPPKIPLGVTLVRDTGTKRKLHLESFDSCG